MSEQYDAMVSAAIDATEANTPKAYLNGDGIRTAVWVLGEREQGINTLVDGKVIFIPWSSIRYVEVPDLA